MRACLSCGLALVLIACGGDDSEGDTSAILDQLWALEMERDMLECACEPDACSGRDENPFERQCVKSVVSRHAAQLEPELTCEIHRRTAQNDCYADTDCRDPVAWEACYDAGGDCDDSYRESIEEEFEICEPEEEDAE